MGEFWPTFAYGYDELTRDKAAWLEGMQMGLYHHKKEYGIEHLKRPDHFPGIDPLPDSCYRPVNLFHLFNAHLPPEIILLILSFIQDGRALRALECTSKSWLSFLSSPVVQPFWRNQAVEVMFMPGAMDWTKSAENVRRKYRRRGDDASNIVWNWRQYYRDCTVSPNMLNRRRIFMAVQGIDQYCGNCDHYPEEEKPKRMVRQERTEMVLTIPLIINDPGNN
jgi:hypothetical protein